MPPHIKNIIELRDLTREKDSKNEEMGNISQFGILIFVDERGTSKECPYCGRTPGEGSQGEEKKKKVSEYDANKFKQKKYECGASPACDFSTNNFIENTKFLSEINDPDKVACYNICKRIKHYTEIKKLSERLEGTNNNGIQHHHLEHQ